MTLRIHFDIVYTQSWQTNRVKNMKAISLSEFIRITSELDMFTFEQRLERSLQEYASSVHYIGELSIESEVLQTLGCMTLTATSPTLEVWYSKGVRFTEGDPESLVIDEDHADLWVVTGVVVLDEEGDELSAYELKEYLPPVFSEINYSLLWGCSV